MDSQSVIHLCCLLSGVLVASKAGWGSTEFWRIYAMKWPPN